MYELKSQLRLIFSLTAAIEALDKTKPFAVVHMEWTSENEFLLGVSGIADGILYRCSIDSNDELLGGFSIGPGPLSTFR